MGARALLPAHRPQRDFFPTAPVARPAVSSPLDCPRFDRRFQAPILGDGAEVLCSSPNPSAQNLSAPLTSTAKFSRATATPLAPSDQF